MERLRRALREFAYAWRGDDTERDMWRTAYVNVRGMLDAAIERARVAVRERDDAIRSSIYWRDQHGEMGRYADALSGARDTLRVERDAARRVLARAVARTVDLQKQLKRAKTAKTAKATRGAATRRRRKA
jgi:hypothetical protein